jgi:hypothetical protein
MQTVVISDVHIGTNYKTCWYQQSVHEPYMLALLDYILQNANQGTNPVNRLVILGDLFDFWTYPPSMDPPTIDEILAANPNLFGPNRKFTQVVQALNGNVQYIHGITIFYSLRPTSTRSLVVVIRSNCFPTFTRMLAASYSPTATWRRCSTLPMRAIPGRCQSAISSRGLFLICSIRPCRPGKLLRIYPIRVPLTASAFPA